MSNEPVLKKALNSIHIWAIAVGLVISGEYFGWNYGWAVAGTGGLLIATIIVTILYSSFVFSFTELTTSIPHAGGPFVYASRAFGPLGGLIAGYAILVEFQIATPAVASALGSYVHFLYPGLDKMTTALVFYVLFTFINFLGIKESAVFTLVVTILAVLGLLLYLAVIAPAFSKANFTFNSMPNGWAGVFAALPFAIWFYLAIEGVAMVAEEVKDPHRSIPVGYISGIITLMILAIAVMVFTGGITQWERLSTMDYPLPEAIGIVLGKNHIVTTLFTGIGLFGLIAGLHGIIIANSRQLFALARARYLPAVLAKVNSRFHTPHWALIIGGIVGIFALYTGETDKLILLSVLGAVVMYIVSMLSLFKLRKKEPALERPFRSPLYPVSPFIALLLSVVCLAAIIYHNRLLSLIFFGVLAVFIIFFVVTGRHKEKTTELSAEEILS
jgi:ethanolamine permease